MANSVLHTIDIFNIFCEVVQNYPDVGSQILRPQTFSVVKYREQIHNASLDKTKLYETISANQNIFFSQSWEDVSNDVNNIPFDFPLVFLLQQASQSSDHKRPVYRFMFGVMDLKDRDKTTDTRVDEVKMNDLEVMLSSILNELLDYVYVDYGSTGNYVWRSKNNEFDEADNVRAYFKTAFKNQNSLVFTPFEDWDKSKQLNGMYCDIVIQGELETKTYSY